MVLLAYASTRGSFADPRANVLLWGSAAAGVFAASAIALGASAVLGWLAIGYVLFAALLAGGTHLLLVAFAVALMPLVDRPRGSLALGLLLAALGALVARYAVATLN